MQITMKNIEVVEQILQKKLELVGNVNIEQQLQING